MNRKNGGSIIILPAEFTDEFNVINLFFQIVGLNTQLFKCCGILFGEGEFQKFRQIGTDLTGVDPGFDDPFRVFNVFKDGLGLVGIIPELRLRGFRFELFNKLFFSGYVKDTPEAFRSEGLIPAF